ncbi:MAG: hypothetical protein KDC33_01430 [Thermoleophilia bacterium]|nr:hypothetical protein [Thermoleophilia bacterium]
MAGRRVSHDRPGPAFAEGTTYADAVVVLVKAEVSGTAPSGATLVAPSPAGTYALIPGRTPGASGVVISLTAPWGIDDASGLATAPSIAFSRGRVRRPNVVSAACPPTPSSPF